MCVESFLSALLLRRPPLLTIFLRVPPILPSLISMIMIMSNRLLIVSTSSIVSMHFLGRIRVVHNDLKCPRWVLLDLLIYATLPHRGAAPRLSIIVLIMLSPRFIVLMVRVTTTLIALGSMSTCTGVA